MKLFAVFLVACGVSLAQYYPPGGGGSGGGSTTVNGQTCTIGSSCTVTVAITTGVTGLGANVATFLATPSSANLASALTDETGTSLAVFNTSPLLVTPKIAQINDASGNASIYLSSGLVGVGPTAFTPTHTFDVYNATATTGATVMSVKAGAGDTGGARVFQVLDNTNAFIFRVRDIEAIGRYDVELSDVANLVNNSADYRLAAGGLHLAGTNTGPGRIIAWTSSDSFGTDDTSLSRLSAAKIGIGNGTAGDHSGTLQAATVIIDNSSFSFNGHTCTIVSTVVTCP